MSELCYLFSESRVINLSTSYLFVELNPKFYIKHDLNLLNDINKIKYIIYTQKIRTLNIFCTKSHVVKDNMIFYTAF